ncbi:hypothetical protein [Croceivirga thetidis]|uniref:Uncharacterized protein n=1 Tax=Croceivirga thetidis TaxID=2721623 RepID=A0ABX1GUN8_9FLAO|nr:hypothetical protein [Croceivirga thetidis]NKI32751.1 hypothetical protein [Croceivirga thetidis]
MPLKSFLKSSLIVFALSLKLNAQEYIPNKSLRNNIRIEKWSELKLKTPNKHRTMTGLILKTNQCFDLYTKVAKKLGYPVEEVASMMTFHNVILKENARGKDFSKLEIDNEYQVTKRSFLESGKEKSWSTEQLQNKYDRLLLDAIWIAVINEFSRGHTEETKRLALELLESGNFSKEALVKAKDTRIESRKKDSQDKNSSSKSKPLIEDIILRTVTNYGLNGAYIDNEVSVLFANGEILTNPVGALDELDVMASKNKYPKRWNTWQKKNGIIYVTKSWKGKTYDWKKWFKVRPARGNQKLSGKFNTSDPFGGASVINASTVSFDSSGRFVWKTIKGGDTSWKPKYSRTNEAGTYTIKDYKIILNYNNGRTESFFFGFYPKDDRHFVIGSSHFIPLK